MTACKRWITLICFAVALTLTGPGPSAAVEDALIAVVNDELITLKDLRDYVRTTYASLMAEGMSEAEIQAILRDLERNGINKIIEDRLILSNANEIGLVVKEALLEERLEGLKKKYGSEQNLVDALVQTGATLTDLKNKIRDEMKIKFVIDHQVRSKIYINPQEVTDYYEQHKEEFGRQEKVNLESIFIAYGDDPVTSAANAHEALARIREGEPFSDLAAEYSQMPSVGVVEKGQLLPEIEEKVFGLDIDEVSPVIETETGLYIFKLTGKVPAKVPALEEVKEEINDRIYKEKFRERFLAWITELKDKAYIEIKQ